MSGYKLVATSLDSQKKLATNDSSYHSNPSSYCSLVGALQYVTFTHLNISFLVQRDCQSMHAPTVNHFQAIKCILRYLTRTLHYGLQL